MNVRDLLHSLLLRQHLLLNPELSNLVRLAGQHDSGILLSPPSPVLGLRAHTILPSYYVGAGN